MDANKANGLVNGFSVKLNSITSSLSGWISNLLTMRNIFFIIVIILIGYAAYMLYREDVMRKRYYFRRNREI